MTPDKSRNLVRRYLLGDLSGSDQEHYEEKFMTGDTSLAELEAAEDELLDEYLAGRLTADEYEQFERYFLSTPERQKKLRFATVFHRYVAAHQPATAVTASGFPPSLFSLQNWPARIAIVAMLLLMAGFWVYLRSRSVSPSYATVVTLSLSSSTRSAGANDTAVALPDPVGSLRAILLLPKDARAQNYRVELESDTGEKIATSIIEQKPESLLIEIPSQKLQRRQYVVRLFEVGQGGEQRIPGNYFFSVK